MILKTLYDPFHDLMLLSPPLLIPAPDPQTSLVDYIPPVGPIVMRDRSGQLDRLVVQTL